MGCCSSSNTELVEQLTESPFFCLETKDKKNNKLYLSSLSKRFIKQRYSANETLWEKGDTTSTFNIIIQGEVRLQFKEDSSKQMVIVSKTAGQCFGFDSLNRSVLYDCIAVTDIIVYSLSYIDLEKYFDRNKISYNIFSNCSIIPIDTYLQSLDVFSSISIHDSCLLSSMFRWKQLNKNEILFNEGTLGEEYYIVASGCVAVVVTIAKSENYSMRLNDKNSNSDEFIVGGHQLNMLDPEKFNNLTNNDNNNIEEKEITEQKHIIPKKNETRIVYEFKSGDYFGEVSLVIKIPRTATIKAIEDTTLLELRKSDFQKFIPDNNIIKVQLEQVAHERIAQSFRRYKIPLFNAVPLNMFHILSRLSEIKYYKKNDIICDPDSNERALYVIAHGNVGVYVTKQRINDKNENNNSKNNNNENEIKNIDIIHDKSTSTLINNDGNSTSNHHKRMSEQLNTNNTNNNTMSTPISSHKRISQHLLPSNLHLITAITQRDKLNRELIRLSFISTQAINKKKSNSNNNSEEYTPLTQQDDNDNIMENINELSHTDDDESSQSQSPIPLLPSPNTNKNKQYPITPPPNMIMNDNMPTNININYNKSLNDLNNIKYNEKEKETTALIQSNSVDMDIKNNNVNDISKLNINLNAENSIDEINIKTITPNGLHTRFHTALGTPSLNNSQKEIDNTIAINNDNNNRRKSENAILKMKITKPMNTPMSVGKIPRTEFLKTQSYGSSLKSNIYERNEKFVRIADLMIPDENIDKLRNQSRRGSRISNYSSRGRAESNYSLSGKTNKTIDGIFVFDIDKHIIKENIKIDPSDPSAFENLDYAKQTYNNNIWNTHNRNNTNATVITNNNTNNNINEISNITHSQITEMIHKQEKEYELKIENVNNNDNLIQYQSSSEKPDVIEIKEEKEEEKETQKTGMNLRDFKSLDGKITYTEIEVSILRTGNFFGETSLMDERKDNDNDNGYEYLNGNTPSNENSKDINFERIETGATTYNDDDIPNKNTSLKKGAPSIYDILNNKNINFKNKKERISNKISRAQTISLVNNKKSNKKKQKNIAGKKLSYGGSHTTFRCVTSCVIYSITKQSLDEFFDIVPSARRWFDIMLSKYNVSLDTVLHIPRAARYFTLFLESEYAEENIHYVLSVNEYKEAFDATSFNNRMEMAQIICNHFISDDGKQQINVSYHQRKLILDKINSGKYITKNMFDITQKAIYILLERDCFPRFKQSHFFHEFLNEAENLALLTKEQYEKELKQEQELMNNNKHKQSIIQKNSIYKIQKVKLNYDPKNNYNKKNKFNTINEFDNNNNNFDNDRITRAKTVI